MFWRICSILLALASRTRNKLGGYVRVSLYLGCQERRLSIFRSSTITIDMGHELMRNLFIFFKITVEEKLCKIFLKTLLLLTAALGSNSTSIIQYLILFFIEMLYLIIIRISAFYLFQFSAYQLSGGHLSSEMCSIKLETSFQFISLSWAVIIFKIISTLVYSLQNLWGTHECYSISYRRTSSLVEDFECTQLVGHYNGCVKPLSIPRFTSSKNWHQK